MKNTKHPVFGPGVVTRKDDIYTRVIFENGISRLFITELAGLEPYYGEVHLPEPKLIPGKRRWKKRPQGEPKPCESCGKIMPGTYGTGRYCDLQCSRDGSGKRKQRWNPLTHPFGAGQVNPVGTPAKCLWCKADHKSEFGVGIFCSMTCSARNASSQSWKKRHPGQEKTFSK